MQYAQVGPGLVAHPVALALRQGGGECAAHYPQRRGQHQQGDQAARRNGVAGNPPQPLHQPAGPQRPHYPRQQGHRQREQAHHQQPQRNQPQRRPQQQREIYLQLPAAQAARQYGAAPGNLPPQKSDDRQRQQVQVIAMDKRRPRRPRPGLPELYDALARRRQRGQRQHNDRQRRAGRAHPESRPGQRNRRPRRRGVKYQPAQSVRQQRR